MTQDDICRRLLLTSEIAQQLQLYAQEIIREDASRLYLEHFASRALTRCAELYALSRPEALGEALHAPASPDIPSAGVPLRLVAAEEHS